jgi:hypothetical protein
MGQKYKILAKNFWLFVNWAAKFIDGQQNYLFGLQKIYFFGQPLS